MSVDPLQRASDAYAAENYDEAYVIWTSSIPLVENPAELSSLHVNRGAALLAQAKFADALRVFDEALALAPKSVEALHNKGVVLNALGKFADAIPLFRDALDVSPSFHDARRMLTSSLTSLEDWPAALVSADEGCVEEPGQGAPLAAKAFVLLKLHRLHDAIACYDAALAAGGAPDETKQQLGSALSQRAIELEKSGDVAGAVAACSRAIDIEPKPSRYHNRGFLKLRAAGSTPATPAEKASLQDAITDFETALKLEPNNGSASHALGTALVRAEDWAAAAAALSKAASLLPDIAEIAYNLGFALLKQDKPADAKTQFQRALAIDPTFLAATKAVAHCEIALIPGSKPSASDGVASAGIEAATTTATTAKPEISAMAAVSKARAAPATGAYGAARAAFSPPQQDSVRAGFAGGSTNNKPLVTVSSRDLLARATSPTKYFSSEQEPPTVIDGFDGITLDISSAKAGVCDAPNFNKHAREACVLSH